MKSAFRLNTYPNAVLDVILGSALFLFSFLIYLKTLAPSLYFGDSGELTAAAFNMGIAHPSGYPLYLILGKLVMTLIPFGDMAYRMNLLSALFAASTVAVVYSIGRIFYQGFLIPVVTAILFAFTSIFWSQAVVAEVYTLSLFFITLIMFFTVYISKTRKMELIPILFLIVGFSLTHHLTVVFVLPSVIVYLFASNPEWIKNKRLLFRSFLFLLLPLPLYLYLPIRSSANPLNDWGNPETFLSVFEHIAGRQFFDKWLIYGADGFLFHLKNFMAELRDEFLVPFSGIIAIGILSAIKKNRQTAFCLLSYLAVNIVASCAYFITDIDAYFIPSFLILTLFIGFGFSFLYGLIQAVQNKLIRGSFSLALILLSLLPLANNFSKNDQSRNFLARNFGMNIMSSLEKDGVLFVDDEETLFVLSYFKIVEGMRPDAEIYDLKQNIFFIPPIKKLGGDKTRFTYAHLSQFQMEMVFKSAKPVYFTSKQFENFRFIENGLLYKVVRDYKDIEQRRDVLKAYDLEGLDRYADFHDAPSRIMIGRYFYALAMDRFQKKDESASETFLRKAVDAAGDQHIIQTLLGTFYIENRNLERAKESIDKAIELNPFKDDVYNMRGMIDHYEGDLAGALTYYSKSLSLRESNVPALLNRSLLYEHMGDNEKSTEKRKNFYEKAGEDLRQVKMIEPLNFQVKLGQARLFPKISGGSH